MDPRPHDLLRLDPDAFEIPDDAPARVARELTTREKPWVVVRRAVAAPGMAAVGVRGRVRRERWALTVPLSCVRDRRTPETLAQGRRWRCLAAARRALPAFAALEAAAGLLEGCGFAWGPGGSVGYELATGVLAVTENSDLDLILRCPEPMSRAEARAVLQDLGSLPARNDAQVETGAGSVALAEWAAGGRVLLRRPEGPVLTDSPWTKPGPPRRAADISSGPSSR